MKKYSSKRKIFYGLVSVLFLVFLMEAIASIADYQEHGKYAFALIGLIKNARTVIHGEKVKKQILQNQGVVRKDSAQKVNQLIANENAAANRLVYEPWLEYRMADFSGQFVNTHGLNRKTMPATA